MASCDKSIHQTTLSHQTTPINLTMGTIMTSWEQDMSLRLAVSADGGKCHMALVGPTNMIILEILVRPANV
jgi:hypothetical protein